MNQKTIKITGDTGELRRCPYCGSEDIIGHGVQHNGSHPKRKKCKDCGRAFNMKKYKGTTEMVLIDAYKGYEKFIEKYLTDGEKKPLTGVINRSQYAKTEGFVNYALFWQSKQSVENKLASLGLGRKITTALIECLNPQIRNLCNYMRRHSKRIPIHVGKYLWIKRNYLKL
jgi:transcription elongation factor Elf1